MFLTNTSKCSDVILVVLRCRFQRSESITHTTSMIFLLYQSTIKYGLKSLHNNNLLRGMKTDDEERTNHSHCLISKQRSHLVNYLVTINKTHCLHCIDSDPKILHSFSPQTKGRSGQPKTTLLLLSKPVKEGPTQARISTHGEWPISITPCSTQLHKINYTWQYIQTVS